MEPSVLPVCRSAIVYLLSVEHVLIDRLEMAETALERAVSMLGSRNLVSSTDHWTAVLMRSSLVWGKVLSASIATDKH